LLQQRPARLLYVMVFAYFAFGLTGVIGALTPDIIADYHVTRFAAGFLGSALYLAMAVFAIPSGLLTDSLGARIVVMSGVAMMGLGSLVMTQSHGYALILAMIFAIGVGQTLIQTCGNPLIQKLDVPRNYHRNLTFTIAFATFGGFLSIFFLACIKGTGRPWQSYYFIFAIVCLIVLLFLGLSKFPPRAGGGEPIRLDQIGKLLRNPILLTYGLGVYIYVSAEFGTYFWIPKFFEDVHHVPAAAANAGAATFLQRVFPSLPALIYALFLGMQGVGRLVGGAVLNRFGCRRVLRFYSVMALASLLVATFGSKILTIIGFVACGFFTSVIFTLIFSGTINSFTEYQGTISGLLCTAYVGPALVSPLEGWVGDHFGMRMALLVPAILMTYVVGLAMFGRAKYE